MKIPNNICTYKVTLIWHDIFYIGYTIWKIFSIRVLRIQSRTHVERDQI